MSETTTSSRRVFTIHTPQIQHFTREQTISWDLERIYCILPSETTEASLEVTPTGSASQAPQVLPTRLSGFVLRTGQGGAETDNLDASLSHRSSPPVHVGGDDINRDEGRPAHRLDYGVMVEVSSDSIGRYPHVKLIRYQPTLTTSPEVYRLLIDTASPDTWMLGKNFANHEHNFGHLVDPDNQHPSALVYRPWPRLDQINQPVHRHATVPMDWPQDVSKLPNLQDGVCEIAYPASSVWVVPSHKITCQIQDSVDDKRFDLKFSTPFEWDVAVAAAATASEAMRPYDGIIGLCNPLSYYTQLGIYKDGFTSTFKRLGLANPETNRFYIRILPGSGEEDGSHEVYSFLAFQDWPCTQPCNDFCNDLPVIPHTITGRMKPQEGSPHWWIGLSSMHFIGADGTPTLSLQFSDTEKKRLSTRVYVDSGTVHTWLPGAVDYIKGLLGQPVGVEGDNDKPLYIIDDDEKTLSRLATVEFTFEGDNNEPVIIAGDGIRFLTGGYGLDEQVRSESARDAIPAGALQVMLMDPRKFTKTHYILGSNFFQTFMVEFNFRKIGKTRRSWVRFASQKEATNWKIRSK